MSDDATPSAVVGRRRRKCICRLPHCAREGFEGSISLPDDPEQRKKWLYLLGWPEGESCPLSDPRVALPHFKGESIYCTSTQGKVLAEGSEERSSPSVFVFPESCPTVSNADMEKASKGALERLVRAQALNRRYAEKVEDQEAARLKFETKLGRAKMALAEKTAKTAAPGKKRIADVPKTGVPIDYTILATLTPDQSRSMCGMPDLPCFEVRRCLGLLERM